MRETVIIVSDDLKLLETRAEVLRHIGLDVLPFQSHHLITHWPEAPVALAILCHTLDEEARAAILTGIQQRWPAAKTLQVVSSLKSLHPQGANVTSSNPALLVASVISTLNASNSQAN
jgi:hypothetical protein